MPAYLRGELSIEAYLVRLLAAACRQNGGELRLKGELVDTPGDSTALMKTWDEKKQEIVLTVSMGSFSEIYRVTPEKQISKQQVLFPTQPGTESEPLIEKQPSRHGQTLDNPNLDAIEKTLQKRRVAAMLKEELRSRKQNQTGE
jgi:hypothetical protein